MTDLPEKLRGIGVTAVQDLTGEAKFFSLRRESHLKPMGAMIVDGEKVVARAMQGGLPIRSILATQNHYLRHYDAIASLEGAKLFCAGERFMAEIVGHRIHQGMMALCDRPQDVGLDELGSRVVVLDQLTDLQNVGAVLRNALAFHFDGILVASRGCSPYARRAVRVSMGAAFKLRIHHCDDLAGALAHLKERGIRVYGAGLWPDSQDIGRVQFAKAAAIVIGNEHSGISPEVLAQCDEKITIPLGNDIDSLNAGCASSILLYAADQQAET